MGLTGVTTTGIYCRPGCSARPRPDNCVPLSSAVAAEAAGYRACRRCRPELEPGALLIPRLPEQVRWGLDLVDDDAVSDDDELARRVGLSARHLRRLFLHHLGATASDIARSRRAHLARRLLDQPGLNLDGVAAATGLTSPRQLHRLMSAVFKAPPSELRGRSSAGTTDVDGITLYLRAVGGLDPSQLLGHLAQRCIPGTETVHDGAYHRTFRQGGHSGIVSVRPDRGGIAIEVSRPVHGDIATIVQRCRRLFGVDEAPLGQRSPIADDQLLGPVAAAHPMLRVPRCFDRFETVIRIVVGQQVSLRGASTLAGRVARRAGPPITNQAPGLDTVFPTPEELAAADLSGLGLTERRAATIVGVARAVIDNRIDLYQPGTIDDIVTRWTTLDGIGPWTAHMIAMRVLAHDDAMPSGDLGVRRAVAAMQGIDIDAATPAAVATLAEPWAPHRSWAAQLLWAAADPAASQTRTEHSDG